MDSTYRPHPHPRPPPEHRACHTQRMCSGPYRPHGAKSSSPPAAGGMVGCGPGLFTVASRCLISNSGHRANGFEFEDTQAASIWEKSVSAFLEPEKKRTGSLATLGDRGRV